MRNKKIVGYNDSFYKKTIKYLSNFNNACVFLLIGIYSNNAFLNLYKFSGDYKLLFDGDEIVGVFVLMRSGDLLLHVNKNVLLIEKIFDTLDFDKIKNIIAEIDIINMVKNIYFPPADFIIRNGMELPFLEKKQCHNLYHKNVVVRKLSFNDDADDFRKIFKEYIIELKLNKTHNSQEDKIWWGMFYNDKLVGILGVGFLHKNFGFISTIFVNKCYRNRLLGSHMLSYVIYHYYQNNLTDKMILFVREDNVSAQNFYANLGFLKTCSVGFMPL